MSQHAAARPQLHPRRLEDRFGKSLREIVADAAKHAVRILAGEFSAQAAASGCGAALCIRHRLGRDDGELPPGDSHSFASTGLSLSAFRD